VPQRATAEPNFFAFRVTEITPADTHMAGRFSPRDADPSPLLESFAWRADPTSPPFL
jgi:hypothetical protein